MICSQCKSIIPAGRHSCLVCGTPVGGSAGPSFSPPSGPAYAPQPASQAFTRDSYKTTRNWTLGIVGGIVLVSIVAWIVFFSPVRFRLPSGFGVTDSAVITLDPSTIESGIHDEILAQRSADLSIDCPSLMEGVQGTEWQCIAEETDGTRHIVNVQLQNALGEIVWELIP
jgi:hypothetical protein